MLNLINDIRSGALPPSEWISFTGFILRKAAWLLIALAVFGTLILFVMH